MLTKEELIDLAIKARELSYSPYSNFKVGAAILTKDGEYFLGANVENSSYPVSMCAERNAIYNAMMHGKKKEDFVALAIVADSPRACSPCGMCRQAISELYPASAPIYLSNLSNDLKITNAKELLPYAFEKEDMEK